MEMEACKKNSINALTKPPWRVRAMFFQFLINRAKMMLGVRELLRISRSPNSPAPRTVP